MKRIEYMVDKANQLVYSRVNSEVAIPVLDYDEMKPENKYQMNYHLEKFNILDVIVLFKNVLHTRKIPVKIKNVHRKFWNMKPLKT